MAPVDTGKELVTAGQAWAERQHEAGAPSSWIATWEQAVELGLAPRDERHESASLCAAAARSRWRELRPDAPRRTGNRTDRRGRGKAPELGAMVKLRCSAHQREAWTAAAKARETELSDWIRAALDRAAKIRTRCR